MDLTDKEYVQRCRDGHPDDFRLLVHRYQGLRVWGEELVSHDRGPGRCRCRCP